MTNKDQRPMIHIRLTPAVVRAVDHVSVELGQDRSRTIEALLWIGLAKKAQPGLEAAIDAAAKAGHGLESA